MKVVIIGAGISGVLAANYFKTDQIFDQAKIPVNQHKAVMRIRDPRVGMLLGCDMEKIHVYKGVFFDGHLHNSSNITMNNMYSVKVSGELSNKSIIDLLDSERYLLKNFNFCQANYGYELFSISNNVAHFKCKEQAVEVMYDFCISTIPIPSVILACGEKFGVEFNYNPIFVTRFDISLLSSVNQTIYFPEMDFKAYRVSLEDKTLIIESICSHPDDSEIKFIFKVFGIDYSYALNKKCYQQKYGKLVSVDDSVRKFIIHSLTDKYNIYSLGRFAIWKQIRADNVLSDLEVIRKLISYGDMRRSYESKLDRI